jgi:hypothetical protein
MPGGKNPTGATTGVELRRVPMRPTTMRGGTGPCKMPRPGAMTLVPCAGRGSGPMTPILLAGMGSGPMTLTLCAGRGSRRAM